MRFSLRTMLILVAALALLLAQYPYVRFVMTSWITEVNYNPGDEFVKLDHIPTSGYYVPTTSFAAVAIAEIAAGIAWLVYSRRPVKKSFD
jgi:hypothetical protein